MFNFVLCQVRYILFNTNLTNKNNSSFVKTILKMLSITTNLVKLRYECKKYFGQPCSYFLQSNSFQNFFEACFNFNLIIVQTSHCKAKKTMVFSYNHCTPPHAYLVNGVQLFTHLQPLNFVERHLIYIYTQVITSRILQLK